jgi:hypothetical protein
MELLIEFKDDNSPLEKPVADALVEEIRAACPPDVASVSLRERRPGFGELGSLAHIWQVAVDLATSHQALAAGGGAAIASAVRQIFRLLEKRQEQKVVLKGPGFELQGPASMFADRTGELMDRVQDAIAAKKKAPARRPARSAASSAKSRTPKKHAAKRTPPPRSRKKP